MLQRIQSVFLLLVSVVSVVLMFVPFVGYDLNSPQNNPLTLLPVAGKGNANSLLMIPAVLNILVLLFSLFVIFGYKKRIRQMKMAHLLLALNGILMGLMLLLEYKDVAAGAPAVSKSYLAGAYLPIASMLFSFLAARSIKKDEELVRSADRIR